MPKLNKYFKDINSSALEAITDKRIKDKLVKTLKAIEGYVCMAMIAMGLLQIISLNFSKELNSSSFRWLRTTTNGVVSEATVAYFFRKNIFRVIEKYKHLRIMRIIIANQKIEIWAKEREEWLRKYLELPNGIPSQYTYERVFDAIDPKQFAKCFTEWMRDVTEMSKGTIVAIDGKHVVGQQIKTKVRRQFTL